MELQRIVTILLRRWWLVLGMPALVLGVSLILLSNSPYVASIRVSVLIPGDTQETGNAERPELMVLDDVTQVVTAQVFATAISAELQQSNPQFALPAEEIQAALSADYYSRIVTIRATDDDSQQALALIEAVRLIFERELNYLLIASGGDPATVRLIEPASVGRDSPATGGVALAIQTLVALAIGCGLAALAAAFDQRIHTRRDALAAVPEPVLGHLRVPRSGGRPRRREPGPAGPGGSPDADRKSAEATRALRATMRATRSAGREPGRSSGTQVATAPVWLVVPVDQGEDIGGLVAERLGAAGAAAGERCLVLDTTTVRPQPEPAPLAGWLLDETDDTPPLPVPAAGGSAELVRLSPASEGRDLMRGPRWDRALAEARTSYDDVLIGVRPMTASADAMALASHIDAILLLVVVGRTDGSALVQARSALQAAGGTIAGTVLVTAEERIG